MNLLIITRPEDVHAVSVATVLTQLGHTVVLWSGQKSSSSSEGPSIIINNDECKWKICGETYEHDFFNLIWYRKRSVPKVSELTHKEDAHFAHGEINSFYSSLWNISCASTTWLHSPLITESGENKIKQLAVARRVGFSIPDTVISSNYHDIADFHKQLDSSRQQMIYKTFNPGTWREKDAIKIKHTTVVEGQDITDSCESLSTIPGIYQQRLLKSHEVRTNIFGDEIISASLNVQHSEYGSIDWRNVADINNYIEPVSLPEEVSRRCASFMKEMGLCMGAIDFVVDKSGNYHFLEINTQGQFLWIEEARKDIRLLERCLNFLIAKSDCSRSHGPVEVSYHEIMNSQKFADIANAFFEAGYYANL